MRSPCGVIRLTHRQLGGAGRILTPDTRLIPVVRGPDTVVRQLVEVCGFCKAFVLSHCHIPLVRVAVLYMYIRNPDQNVTGFSEIFSKYLRNLLLIPYSSIRMYTHSPLPVTLVPIPPLAPSDESIHLIRCHRLLRLNPHHAHA